MTPEDQELEELKDIVTSALEKKNVLGKIRAELRSAVYAAIDEEEKKLQTSTRPKQFEEVMQHPEAHLAISLVREFLDFCQLGYTLSVFLPEGGIDSKAEGREHVAQQLGITDRTSRPLLVQAIEALLSHRCQSQSSQAKSTESSGTHNMETTSGDFFGGSEASSRRREKGRRRGADVGSMVVTVDSDFGAPLTAIKHDEDAPFNHELMKTVKYMGREEEPPITPGTDHRDDLSTPPETPNTVVAANDLQNAEDSTTDAEASLGDATAALTTGVSGVPPSSDSGDAPAKSSNINSATGSSSSSGAGAGAGGIHQKPSLQPLTQLPSLSRRAQQLPHLSGPSPLEDVNGSEGDKTPKASTPKDRAHRSRTPMDEHTSDADAYDSDFDEDIPEDVSDEAHLAPIDADERSVSMNEKDSGLSFLQTSDHSVDLSLTADHFDSIDDTTGELNDNFNFADAKMIQPQHDDDDDDDVF